MIHGSCTGAGSLERLTNGWPTWLGLETGLGPRRPLAPESGVGPRPPLLKGGIVKEARLSSSPPYGERPAFWETQIAW